MSETIDLTKPDFYQPPRLPEQPISPIDPLRRDFIAECLAHVSNMAATAGHAISIGEDRLYSVQIDMMRMTLREVVRTFSEIEEAR